MRKPDLRTVEHRLDKLERIPPERRTIRDWQERLELLRLLDPGRKTEERND